MVRQDCSLREGRFPRVTARHLAVHIATSAQTLIDVGLGQERKP